MIRYLRVDVLVAIIGSRRPPMVGTGALLPKKGPNSSPFIDDA
jgi:hypothetical protein